MQETQLTRGSVPELGRSPGEGYSNLLQYFLPGKPCVQRSLPSYSPWSHKELETIEHSHAGTDSVSVCFCRLPKHGIFHHNSLKYILHAIIILRNQLIPCGLHIFMFPKGLTASANDALISTL